MKGSVELIVMVLLALGLVGGLLLVNRNSELRKGAYFAGAEMIVQPGAVSVKVGDTQNVAIFVNTGTQAGAAKVDFVKSTLCFGQEWTIDISNPNNVIYSIGNGGAFDVAQTGPILTGAGTSRQCLTVVESANREAASLQSGMIQVALVKLVAAAPGSGTIEIDKNQSAISGANPDLTSIDMAIQIASVTNATDTVSPVANGIDWKVGTLEFKASDFYFDVNGTRYTASGQNLTPTVGPVNNGPVQKLSMAWQENGQPVKADFYMEWNQTSWDVYMINMAVGNNAMGYHFTSNELLALTGSHAVVSNIDRAAQGLTLHLANIDASFEAPTSAIDWKVGTAEIKASDFYLDVGGTRYIAGPIVPVGTTGPVATFDGVNNQNLALNWTEKGNPVRLDLAMKFTADGWKLFGVTATQDRSIGLIDEQAEVAPGGHLTVSDLSATNLNYSIHFKDLDMTYALPPVPVVFNPIDWKVGTAEIKADDFYIDVGGTRYVAMGVTANTEVSAVSSQGQESVQNLVVWWMEKGKKIEFSGNFAWATNYWRISNIDFHYDTAGLGLGPVPGTAAIGGDLTASDFTQSGTGSDGAAVTFHFKNLDTSFGIPAVPTPILSPIDWTIGTAHIMADDFYIDVGGTRYVAQGVGITTAVSDLTWNSVSQDLKASWYENGKVTEMKYHFNWDGSKWWVDSIRVTTVGQEVMDYEFTADTSPKMSALLGGTYTLADLTMTGAFDSGSVRMSETLHLSNLKMTFSQPTLPAVPCNVCPSTFSCYYNQSLNDYHWFAGDTYAQLGYKSTADSNCNANNKPTYVGREKGDANCDGVVDGDDYSVWRREYLDEGNMGEVVRDTWWADFPGANMVCDGKVDNADYSVWRRTYAP